MFRYLFKCNLEGHYEEMKGNGKGREDHKKFRQGILYAILATLIYGSIPVTVKMAYSLGITTSHLLFWRAFFAVIIGFGVVKAKGLNLAVSKNEFRWLALIGFISLLSTLGYNRVYHILSGVVGSIVSLSYVLFVFVIEILIGTERLSVKKGFALLIAFVGFIIIVMPGESQKIDMVVMSLGFLTSVLYAIQMILVGKGGAKNVPTEILFIYMSVPTLICTFVSMLLSSESLFPNSISQWAIILWMAVMNMYLSRLFFYKSIRLIGTSLASLVDMLEPFVAAAFSFVFLSEYPTINVIMGTILILLSIVWISKEKSAENDK